MFRHLFIFDFSKFNHLFGNLANSLNNATDAAALMKPKDTFSFRGEQSTGIETLSHGGRVTSRRITSETVYKNNMSKQQYDSMVTKFNSSNTYWNNQFNKK